MKKVITAVLSVILAVIMLCVPASADGITDDLALLIREASEKFEEYIDISAALERNHWKKEDIGTILTCAYLYMPELFYVKNSVTIYYGENGKCYASFGYTMTKEEAAAARIKLDAAAKKVTEGINPGMSDVEKALYVHDYLILNCKYDFTYKNYDAYDCLVSKSAVCQGYSLAYMYILKKYLGIDCSVVYSDSQSHAWNYVKIGNNWYHVDLTTDDASTVYKNISYDNLGFVMHENFLMSDKQCMKTSDSHRDWIVIGSYPAATDTKYDDAFWRASNSEMCFLGRKCYYSVKETDGKTRYSDLYVYDFVTGKNSLLLKLKNKWYCVRSDDGTKTYEYGKNVYLRCWMSVTSCGGKIYFNSNRSVFSYDPVTKKYKKVYSLNKKGQQIFGLYYTGTKIRVAYRADTTYPEKYVGLVFRKS